MSFDTKKVDDKVTLYENNKVTSYERIDFEIRKLRPISIIEDIAWIQVYLPTKQTIELKNKTITTRLYNHPYFITSDKKLINAKSPDLIEKFQLPDFMPDGNVRWEQSDIDRYLSSTDKVNLKNAFEQIRNHTSKIIELKNNDHLNVYILWSIGTYFYKIFEFYPYLDFIASKGSGKSKALGVLECLCYNAYLTSRLTGAAWSRMVESYGCTLLIDEQENLDDPATKSEHIQNLTTMLRSAFKTDAQVIINVPLVGSSWTPKSFPVGVPVSLAHIGQIHEVTADRTIRVGISKTTNKEIANAEVDGQDKIWPTLRNSYYRMFLDYYQEVKEIKKENIGLEHISSRERNQLWKPIIVLAKLFERHGVTGLVESVLRVVEETHEMRTVTNQSSNPDIQTLEFLCETLGKVSSSNNNNDENNWYSQQTILAGIRKNIPGLEYLSSKELGSILDRLDLKRKKRNDGMKVFITTDLLKILCQKYNLDFEALTEHKAHSAQSNDKSA